VHAIQCTLSDRHPKPKTAYESLRRKLDLGPGDRMIVYFATLSKYEQSYINGSKSTFWKNELPLPVFRALRALKSTF